MVLQTVCKGMQWLMEKRNKQQQKKKKNHVLTLYFSHGLSCFISYNIYRFCIIFKSLYGNFTVIVQRVEKQGLRHQWLKWGASKNHRRENSRLLDPPNLWLTPRNWRWWSHAEWPCWTVTLFTLVRCVDHGCVAAEWRGCHGN